MKQHILVVCQYFYPEEFRINDISKEWVKRGYEVTVITGIPNYPQGKFYDGFGWFRRRREEYEGVRIIRLPIIPRGKNPLMLILNYLSFVISGFFWKTFTGVKADKVFIFQLSPLTQALVGVWYAKRRKIPCSIYVQDLWPENVEGVLGIHNKFIIGMIHKMADYIYKNCNKVFATSPSFQRRIEERPSAWKDGKSKVFYWPQYAEDFYQPVERNAMPDIPDDGIFKIVFTGNIGYAQGLDILPKTAAILKHKNIACEFVVIGDGRYREEFEKEISQCNVKDRFLLLGRKKPDEIPGYLAWCDVAFISFADNPLFDMTIPAKLQSYMACAMPILAVAGGETRRIVEEAGCGMCIEERSPEALAAGIESWLVNGMPADCGERARQYSINHFSQKALLDSIEW